MGSSRKIQPKYIQETIALFVRGVQPVLFSGSIESFKVVLQQIWNSPSKEFRKKIKFRTSFTPSDLEGIKDLTLVSIQKEFLPKWGGQLIIQSENAEPVEITSHSEALFLGHKEDNPFYLFLLDLNVNQSDFQIFGQCYKVYNDYINLDKVDDANTLRQDIRLLSKISPYAFDGSKIKEVFIQRLELLIHSEKDSNLKALRNLELTAFHNGEVKGRKIFSDFMANQLTKEIQVNQIAELFDIACNEEPKNWWHYSIQDSFKSLSLNFSKKEIENIWQLFAHSEKALKNISSLLPATKELESQLRDNIQLSISKETAKNLESISLEREWFMLHADLLLTYLQPNIAIARQLVVEEALELKASKGVQYISDKIPSHDLVALTLKSNDPKLIQLTVERILKDNSLLKHIDVTVSCWLKIWSNILEKSRNISVGIEGKEQIIINSLFDLLINGVEVPEIIIESIANSEFADISNYSQRAKLWSKISSKWSAPILDKTAQAVLFEFLSGNIDFTSIESKLSYKITSDDFMTEFLSEYKKEIKSVIKVYESFSNLKDEFLADYISYYRNPITKEEAIQLGTLVNMKGFDKSAKSIYDKSKYNHSFKLAYEHCKELVNIGFWSAFRGSTHKNHKSHSNLSPTEVSKTQQSSFTPTVVILTAIKEEYVAVRQHLKEIEEIKKNDTYYEVGVFELFGRKIANVIIRECGAKNTTSAIETERAIHYFNPNGMFFVGIAGSRKPKDFSIGDVIIPESVLSYEGGKSEKESFLSRPDLGILTYAICEIAKAERKKKDWKMLILNSWDVDSVKADIGVIASGEQVVEHYESEVGKILTKHFNHTSAVEMEGFGFAKTINRQGRETSMILTGIVRGISDIIEQPSGEADSNSTDRRPTNAKQFASDTAAAFAYWLIYKAFE